MSIRQAAIVSVVALLIASSVANIHLISGWLQTTAVELNDVQLADSWAEDVLAAGTTILFEAQRSSATDTPPIGLGAPVRQIRLKLDNLESKLERTVEPSEIDVIRSHVDSIRASSDALIGQARDGTTSEARQNRSDGERTADLLALQETFTTFRSDVIDLSDDLEGIRSGRVDAAVDRSANATLTTIVFAAVGAVAVILLLLGSIRAARTLRHTQDELSGEKSILETVIATMPARLWWTNSQLEVIGGNGDVAGWRTEDVQYAESRVLATGAPCLEEQHQVVDHERSSWHLQSTVPLSNGARTTGVLTLVSDITQVMDLQERVDQVSRLESIGRLAAGVAHEINTPIQFVADNTTFVGESVDDLLSIVTQLDRIARSDDELPARVSAATSALEAGDVDFIASEAPRALSDVQEGVTRVTSIVQGMKSFSHMGDGIGPTDINDAIRSTVAVSRNEWKYHADLDLDLDDDIGTIDADVGALKQVLLNLIVNSTHAIEAVEGRPGRITISSVGMADSVEIAVTDNGSGIEPEVASKVFEPFFTTKDVGKGTGQGLAHARNVVVNEHGGELTVESEPGHGSTFRIELPRLQPVVASPVVRAA